MHSSSASSLTPWRSLSRSNRGVPSLSYEAEQMMNVLFGSTKSVRSSFQPTHSAHQIEQHSQRQDDSEDKDKDKDKDKEQSQEEDHVDNNNKPDLRKALDVNHHTQYSARGSSTAASISSSTSTHPSADPVRSSPSSSSSSSVPSNTPFDRFFASVNAAMTVIGDDCLGYQLVRGVGKHRHGKTVDSDDDNESDGDNDSANDDDDDEKEDGDDDEKRRENQRKNLTEEDMAHMRIILLTKRRVALLEKFELQLLGDQYKRSMQMFTTSFSYDVLDEFQSFQRSYAKKNLPLSEKFDLLFAFTWILQGYDSWIHDHEVGWGGDKHIKKLGNNWKELLKNTDEALGIDSQFTRPGIMCMLENLKKKIESTEDEPALKFNFSESRRRKRTRSNHEQTEEDKESDDKEDKDDDMQQIDMEQDNKNEDGKGDNQTKKDLQTQKVRSLKKLKLSSSAASDHQPRLHSSLSRTSDTSSTASKPLLASASSDSPSSSSSSSSSSTSSSSLSSPASPASSSSSSSSVVSRLDAALLKVRDRFTTGLLRAICNEGHGSPPSGRKPYASYQEGMTETIALRLMSGYDAYMTSHSKKLIRWLFFDVPAILRFLSCSAVIASVPYSGWIMCETSAEAHAEVDAEFEALEVRFDQERNLMIFTSRTRLHSTDSDGRWPPTKHVFLPSKQK